MNLPRSGGHLVYAANLSYEFRWLPPAKLAACWDPGPEPTSYDPSPDPDEALPRTAGGVETDYVGPCF